MSLRSFLYFLFDTDKLPFYQDSKGFIQKGDQDFKKPDGSSAHLNNAPDGWKDVLIKYARNTKYWGMFRSMTVPMRFSEDGANILKKIMWNGGIEAICYLGILKLDRYNLGHNYRNYYLSEINFVKYKEEKTYVTVEALDGGLSKYIKAYEKTQFEIPIDDDPEHVEILFDGMPLANTATFTPTQDATVQDLAYARANHLVGLQLVSKEVSDIGGAFDVLRTKVKNNNADIRGTGLYFFRATEDGTLAFEWDFELLINYYAPPAINPAASVNTVIRRIDKTGVSTFILSLFFRNRSQGIPGSYHVIGSGNVPVRKDDELYLYTFANPEGASGDVQMEFIYSGHTGGAEPFFKFTYDFKYQPTYVKGLTAYTFWKRLTDKLGDSLFPFTSDFISNELKNIVLVSGDSLRGLAGASIKISLTDAFQSFNRWCIGLAPENDTLRIERRKFFHNNTILVNLGKVADANITVADDLLFNTIKNGYSDQNYTDVNGKYEFNQGQEYTTTIKKITSELDLVSKIRADAYGMELLRLNYSQKKTTDTSSDNDTFFVDCVPGNPYTLNRPQYHIIQGVLYPKSIFNVELSPKRSLIEWGGFIHSILDYLDATNVTYQTSDKNDELLTVSNGVEIKENGDLLVANLPPKYFKPYYLNLKTSLPINIQNLIKTNPYGKVQFEWNNRQWYGWLVDPQLAPANEDAQDWKLLCSPENDLSKFNATF